MIANGYENNASTQKDKQYLYTGEYDFKVSNSIKVGLEGGISAYTNAEIETPVSEIAIINLDISKRAFNLPLTIQYCRIGQYVINQASPLINTSANNNLNNDPAYDLMLRKGFLGESVDLMNNRQSLLLGTKFRIGPFIRGAVKLNMAQELQNLHNEFTFIHRSNAYVRSQFNFWTRGFGPKGNLIQFYQVNYEFVGITDSTVMNSKKGFNHIDFDFKYKARVGRRTLYFMNFTNIASVQEGIAPVPMYTKKALFRTIYNELMAYFEITGDLYFVGTLAFEKNNANHQTELGSTGLPLDQIGWSKGIGIDWAITDNTAFYIRHNFISHEDRSFPSDRFKGSVTTFELKTFF